MIIFCIIPEGNAIEYCRVPTNDVTGIVSTLPLMVIDAAATVYEVLLLISVIVADPVPTFIFSLNVKLTLVVPAATPVALLVGVKVEMVGAEPPKEHKSNYI